MPVVSVIIPTYNRAHCIREAIESVLNQSYRDFELLVIDDGSTDSTGLIVQDYQDRLAYYFQENRGPSAARNLGIARSSGQYIAFLDSDDCWLKNKLRIQMELMNREPDTHICYTDEIWIRNGVRVNQKKNHRKYSGWIYQKCLPLCIISPSSVLLHRKVFDRAGRFDELFPVCEDYDLWLRVSAIYSILFIPRPLIIKRGGHPDQLSKKFWGMDRFRISALEKILTRQELTEQDRTATIEMLKKKCTIIAEGCFKRGKNEQGEKYQKIAAKY